MCHWIHSGKQQSGRGILTLKTLATTPTLDVRALSEKALENAKSVFDQLKYERMLPFNECAHDPVRHDLDTYLLTAVLGIKNLGVLTAMQTLREMLCVEPSIHGGYKLHLPCLTSGEVRNLASKEREKTVEDRERRKIFRLVLLNPLFA